MLLRGARWPPSCNPRWIRAYRQRARGCLTRVQAAQQSLGHDQRPAQAAGVGHRVQALQQRGLRVVRQVLDIGLHLAHLPGAYGGAALRHGRGASAGVGGGRRAATHGAPACTQLQAAAHLLRHLPGLEFGVEHRIGQHLERLGHSGLAGVHVVGHLLPGGCDGVAMCEANNGRDSALPCAERRKG